MAREIFGQVVAALLVACGPGGPGTDTATQTTGSTGDPSTSSTAQATSEASTSVAPTTGSGGLTSTAATSSSASEGTEGATSGTSGATSSGTSSGGSTSGGVVGCDFEGPEVEVTLVDEGAPPPPCGTLEFVGRLAGPAEGPTYKLDGCDCGDACDEPDPWNLGITVPDPTLLPTVPMCLRVVVERTMSKKGCELVGAAIFTDPDASGLPTWVGASLLGPIAAIAPKIQVEAQVAETCPCEGCCGPSERYELVVSAFGDSVTIPETGTGVVSSGGPEAVGYRVHNLESHRSGLCDSSPAIDYVMQLELAP